MPTGIPQLRPSSLPGVLAAVLAVALAIAVRPAAAQVSCAPYCDFTHFYGPFDFTWVRPGLFLYPSCVPSGECSPFLIYSPRVPFRGRVTVHLLRPRRAR